MQPIGIIECDVAQHLGFSRISGCKSEKYKSFRFQTSEKSLSWGTVPAITFAAHTCNHLILVQLLLIRDL